MGYLLTTVPAQGMAEPRILFQLQTQSVRERAERTPAAFPLADREAGSRDLEDFTGGGAGIRVLVLASILLPW